MVVEVVLAILAVEGSNRNSSPLSSVDLGVHMLLLLTSCLLLILLLSSLPSLLHITKCLLLPVASHLKRNLKSLNSADGQLQVLIQEVGLRIFGSWT